MSLAVEIREARKTDAERVVEMSHAVGAHEGMSASRLDTATFLEFGFGPDRVFRCYVADYKSQVVGHACTTQGFDFQEGRPVNWIADLYVDPRYRRRGIARYLMGAIAECASNSGAVFVQWMTAPGNDVARAFYLSIGARDDSGKPMYLGPDEIAALIAADA